VAGIHLDSPDFEIGFTMKNMAVIGFDILLDKPIPLIPSRQFANRQASKTL